MHEALEQLFAVVCGQRSDHSCVIDSDYRLLCQRCLGIYGGAAIAALVHLMRRPLRSPAFLWLNGLCLLQMVPMGLHWVPQGPVLRTISGLAFGFGVVAWMWLPTREPCRVAGRARRRMHLRVYLSLLLASLAIVPAAATLGGELAHAAISILSMIGLAALTCVAVRAVLLARATRRDSLGLPGPLHAWPATARSSSKARCS